MNCKSCGNIVPDGYTTCPFCNSPIEQNEENVETNVVPETPTESVLPEDQVVEVNQDFTNVNAFGNPINETVEAQPEIAEVPAENVEVAQLNIEAAPMETVSEQNESVQTPVDLMASEPSQDVTTSFEPLVETKKSKKGLIIVVAIMLVLLLGVGAGYFYEFQTASFRIDKIVEGMFNKADEMDEKASGKYSVKLSGNVSGQEASVDLSGKYAYDKAINFANISLDLNSVKLGGELLPSTVSLDIFSDKDEMGVFAKNFFDKYITMDAPKTKNNSNLDYSGITKFVEKALKSGLKATKSKQTVGKDEGNNNKLSNIIKIKFDKENIQLFINAFVKELNNDQFANEVAKIAEMDASEVKEALSQIKAENIPEEAISQMSLLEIRFITDVITGSFKGMVVTYGIEGMNVKAIIKDTDDLSLISIQLNNQEIFKIDVKKSKNNYNGVIEASYMGSSFKGEVSAIGDQTPVMPTIDKSKKVKINELSQMDQLTIMGNLGNFGDIGGIIAGMFGSKEIGGFDAEEVFDDDMTSSFGDDTFDFETTLTE